MTTPRNYVSPGDDEPTPLIRHQPETDSNEDEDFSTAPHDLCQCCGIRLRTDDEEAMGMCERCAAE